MRGGWVILGVLAYVTPVTAQQPQSAADARFQVSGYAVEGRVLLRSEDFTRVVSPYVGRGRTPADLERARLALQDTYHDLGHCQVRVALAQPEPKDGMVTFRVAEAPASDVRDCLPALVLDESARRAPAASVTADGAGPAAYSYADPRDPAAPALKPRTPAASAPTLAGAPRSDAVSERASVPTGAAPARRPDLQNSPAAPAPTRAVAPETGQAAVPQGVAVAPYVEGAGARGLSLLSDGPPQDSPRLTVDPPAQPAVAAVGPVKSAPPPPATGAVVAETAKSVAQPAPAAAQAEAKPTPPSAPPAVAAADPVKPAADSVAPKAATPLAAQVLAEAKNPTDARSPFVGTAALAAESRSESPTAQPVRPSVVVAQAEPAKSTPALAAAVTAEASGRPPVVAQAEPAKPAPALPAAATAEASGRPTVIAQAEPATPAPPKAAPLASAAEAVPAAPKFEITRYAVEGNTLLKQEAVDRILAPFAGPGKDFGDVQRALEALQLAYQKEGWGGVEIRLPEQELDKGEVKLRVVEPRIAKITVEGNEYFNEANIRRSVPGLREGETPNSREIGRGIRLANENPSKQSAVVLRASEREDYLDATIRVADVDPKRFSIGLDNTGTAETQHLRLGVAFQHSNMFNRDHVMTLQLITAPTNYHDVQVYGVGYHIPFYSLGDSIDLIAGYSSVDSGTVQDLFVVSGAGTVFAARYNQNLPRWGDLEHRISYGLDYRAYQNNVTPVGGTFKLVPDITVHPVSATYSGSWRSEGVGELSYYLSLVQNIPGGSDGTDEDFKQVGARFPDGTAGYRLFRTGLTYARPIGGDFQIRVRADGQYTDDALISGEMFGIGGADSVRGFNERYVSNDKGYRTSWEIYTPDVAKTVGFDGRFRFLAFYDQGLVRRNKVQPGELPQASLDSAGVGLRLNYKTNLTLRLDVAYVYHDGTTGLNHTGRDGQTKAHFAMAWVW